MEQQPLSSALAPPPQSDTPPQPDSEPVQNDPPSSTTAATTSTHLFDSNKGRQCKQIAIENRRKRMEQAEALRQNPALRTRFTRGQLQSIEKQEEEQYYEEASYNSYSNHRAGKKVAPAQKRSNPAHSKPLNEYVEYTIPSSSVKKKKSTDKGPKDVAAAAAKKKQLDAAQSPGYAPIYSSAMSNYGHGVNGMGQVQGQYPMYQEDQYVSLDSHGGYAPILPIVHTQVNPFHPMGHQHPQQHQFQQPQQQPQHPQQFVLVGPNGQLMTHVPPNFNQNYNQQQYGGNVTFLPPNHPTPGLPGQQPPQLPHQSYPQSAYQPLNYPSTVQPQVDQNQQSNGISLLNHQFNNTNNATPNTNPFNANGHSFNNPSQPPHRNSLSLSTHSQDSNVLLPTTTQSTPNDLYYTGQNAHATSHANSTPLNPSSLTLQPSNNVFKLNDPLHLAHPQHHHHHHHHNDAHYQQQGNGPPNNSSLLLNHASKPPLGTNSLLPQSSLEVNRSLSNAQPIQSSPQVNFNNNTNTNSTNTTSTPLGTSLSTGSLQLNFSGPVGGVLTLSSALQAQNQNNHTSHASSDPHHSALHASLLSNHHSAAGQPQTHPTSLFKHTFPTPPQIPQVLATIRSASTSNSTPHAPAQVQNSTANINALLASTANTATPNSTNYANTHPSNTNTSLSSTQNAPQSLTAGNTRNNAPQTENESLQGESTSDNANNTANNHSNRTNHNNNNNNNQQNGNNHNVSGNLPNFPSSVPHDLSDASNNNNNNNNNNDNNDDSTEVLLPPPASSTTPSPLSQSILAHNIPQTIILPPTSSNAQTTLAKSAQSTPAPFAPNHPPPLTSFNPPPLSTNSNNTNNNTSPNSIINPTNTNSNSTTNAPLTTPPIVITTSYNSAPRPITTTLPTHTPIQPSFAQHHQFTTPHGTAPNHPLNNNINPFNNHHNPINNALLPFTTTTPNLAHGLPSHNTNQLQQQTPLATHFSPPGNPQFNTVMQQQQKQPQRNSAPAPNHHSFSTPSTAVVHTNASHKPINGIHHISSQQNRLTISTFTPQSSAGPFIHRNTPVDLHSHHTTTHVNFPGSHFQQQHQTADHHHHQQQQQQQQQGTLFPNSLTLKPSFTFPKTLTNTTTTNATNATNNFTPYSHTLHNNHPGNNHGPINGTTSHASTMSQLSGSTTTSSTHSMQPPGVYYGNNTLNNPLPQGVISVVQTGFNPQTHFSPQQPHIQFSPHQFAPSPHFIPGTQSTGDGQLTSQQNQ